MMVVLPLPCQALQQGAGLKAEQLELELTGIWVAGATAKAHCAVMPNPEMSFSFIYSFFPQDFFSYLKAEQETDMEKETFPANLHLLVHSPKWCQQPGLDH